MVGICAGEFCQKNDIRERWPRQAAAHRARATRRARGTRAPRLHLARDFLERADVSERHAAAPADDPTRLLPCLQMLIDDLA